MFLKIALLMFKNYELNIEAQKKPKQFYVLVFNMLNIELF